MDWIRMIGLCLLCAAMVMVLRQMNPQMAGLLSAAFGILLVGMVLPGIAAYIEEIMKFLRNLALDEAYFRVMLKAMGIVWITQITVQVCRDLDAPAAACRAEMCGRIALLGVAAPVFMHLTQMAVGILQ